MATKKKKMYKVIKPVRMEDGHGSTLINEQTPQEVLAKHYESGAGKGFIELVDPKAAQPTTDNGKAGQ